MRTHDQQRRAWALEVMRHLSSLPAQQAAALRRVYFDGDSSKSDAMLLGTDADDFWRSASQGLYQLGRQLIEANARTHDGGQPDVDADDPT